MLWPCYMNCHLQGAVNQSRYSRSNLIYENVGVHVGHHRASGFQISVRSCHFVLSLRRHLSDPFNTRKYFNLLLPQLFWIRIASAFASTRTREIFHLSLSSTTSATNARYLTLKPCHKAKSAEHQ